MFRQCLASVGISKTLSSDTEIFKANINRVTENLQSAWKSRCGMKLAQLDSAQLFLSSLCTEEHQDFREVPPCPYF